MSVLEKVAFFQGRRDEGPNKELAKALADSRDEEGIAEIARGLWHEDQRVRSDCVKVVYEIGYIEPELIAGFAEDFLRLLKSRNNRLVWGAMTALATIAPLRGDYLCGHFEAIKSAMESGSVITRDSGVRVVAAIASKSEECRDRAFSYLLQHLSTCRSKDIPQHSESALAAVSSGNRDEFLAALEARMAELTPPQAKRVEKVMREAQEISADRKE